MTNATRAHGPTTMGSGAMGTRGARSGTRRRAATRGFAIGGLEALEGRRLLSTATWNTTTYNASWDDPASWQGNHVPAEGDDIVFPDLGTGDAYMLVLAYQHHDVGNLTFEGDNWNIDTTPGLTINGDIFLTGASAQLVSTAISHDLTLNLAPGSSMLMGSTLTGNGHDIAITGGGEARFGYLVNVGHVNVEAGSASVFSNDFPIARVDAGATLDGYTRVGTLVGNGGTIHPGTADAPDRLWAKSGVSLGAGTTLDIGIGDFDWMFFTSGKGQLVALGGTVDITDATLQVDKAGSYVPAVGDVLTIVSNQTGTATIGTFDGLPEGATFTTADNIAYQIHYNVGGTGHDVTLTAVTPPTVQSSSAPAFTRSLHPGMSVVGHDPRSGADDADLTYTWAVTSAPLGAQTPTFDDNGTASATSIAPHFFAPGAYAFTCTITNADGTSTVQALTTTIKRRLGYLRLSPHANRLHVGDSLQFGGIVIDQFNQHMATQSIAYTVLEGAGTIDAAGLFTATGKGHVRVQITINGHTGVCGATILA